MVTQQTIDILEFYHDKYNRPDFIADDPISIPHRFSGKQDIEIAGLFAATLSWGLRKTILKNCNHLMQLMDEQPHDFILHHSPKELKPFSSFVHRTFNGTDVLYFIEFLKQHYTRHDSLERLFLPEDQKPSGFSAKQGLTQFHDSFFSMEYFPERTRKHIATPERGSTCKRLNMFTRVI